MLFTTATQYAVLALCVFLGWILGLMSRSGGAKWKKQLAAEQQAHAAYVRDNEVRVREHDERLRDSETRLAVAQARIAEMERVRPAVGTGVGAGIGTGVGAGLGTAAVAGGTHNGHDDLSRIHGIGHDGVAKINALGLHSYHDVETLSASDEARIEAALGSERGFIQREQWRDQAALLRAGRFDEHASRYPTKA